MARTPKHIMKKWQVCFRDDRGHYGIIGYILFDKKEAAEEWGKDFKNRNPLIAEIMVKHPAPVYSDY